MNHIRPPSVPRQRGVALIIILAFLVLLSGLVVAFFSRAMSERQVSNSSANQTRVELFSEGAVETLIGDLKQEIAAGSTVPSPAPSPAPNTNLYFPKSNATAVPFGVGRPAAPAPVAGATPAPPALANLLKRSAYSQPFFAGTAYDTTNYPPSNRAANVSTTTLSQNIRSWSTARWNRALLLPKADLTSDTDFTPVTGTDGFTAPDWVLVARDGSNPTAWSTALSNASADSAVIGRYAYTIYDEGGLLDMNAAGYPNGLTPAQTGGKSALAFADLIQLKDSAGTTLLSQVAHVDAIVAWRNYATAQPPNEWPTPSFPPASGTTPSTPGLKYFNAMTGSTKGFLSTTNTALFNDQSDRMFSSRQQLMKLLLSGIASQTTSAAAKLERSKLQSALQYMGTFSRGLDQPSFAPLPVAVAPATADATHRPAIVAVASGGNDAFGGDGIINPSFLTLRATSSFTRNDGSPAVIGEPLVKKRFAINRLAWLTFKGPIANDSGTLSSDTDVQTIITSLKAAGFTDAFLSQGGPANIYKYFGLSWVPDPKDATQKLWVYSHQGAAPLTTAVPPAANIKTLGGGANPVSGREPDFVELLRAGIAAGSVGKGFYNGGGAGTPDDYAYGKDIKSAEQIIQILANIIDQYDIDGYPTRILYDDGTLPAAAPVAQEYRGVEDLPYFYRVRGGLMKVKESIPAISSKQQEPPPGTVTPGNEGLGVAFQQPEIWNPHTWNPSATPNGLRPTTFRFTAVTAPPSQAAPSAPDPNAMTTVPFTRYNSGFQTCPTSNAPIKSISWSQDNTALLFDIPANRPDLFREPTLLIKPKIPAGSNLRVGSQNYLATEATLAPFYSGGGIKNVSASPFYTSNGATDDLTYIGVYMGAFPLLWNATVGGVASICNAFLVGSPNGKPCTYRVQYESTPGSGKWVTYDEKFTVVSMNNGANAPGTSGARPNFIDPVYAIGNDNGRCFIDPRTNRWHVPTCAWNYNTSRQQYEWAPTYSSYGTDFNGTQKSGAAASTTAYTTSNANQYAAAQNALWSLRPDAFSGYVAYPPSASLGWYQTGLGYATGSTNFRPGMLSQNNPSAKSGGWCTNQGAPGQGSSGTQIFVADADNVVRRGMAAYLPPTASDPGDPRTTTAGGPLVAGSTTGEPQQVATLYASNGTATPDPVQSLSRPVILNRPFRSVADLGYVSSGTPWRNLDFSTPESGCAALLDIFCVAETDNADGLVAGKVNLNTRQAPVLQAILAGASKDEYTPSTAITPTGNASATTIAATLVARTNDTAAAYGAGSGPVVNISDLIGKWVGPVAAISPSLDGGKSFQGFSGVETTTIAPVAPTPSTVAPNLSYVLSQDATAAGYNARVVTRYRESAIRALTSAGQTRVWNLMIDLVAQTGRYPKNATNLAGFMVEGEQRLWVHIAIDRYTGNVIDRQIEVVKE